MSQQVLAQVSEALMRPENGTAFAITLMEHLVVPTFVLDAEGRVLIWNRACERLSGIKASEILGTNEHWRAFYDAPRPCLADLVAADDWAVIDKLYTTHDDPGTPAFGVHAENWCVMPRLGRRLYLAVDAGPVFDESGRMIAVVETLRDVTDKKLAQTRIQEQASVLQEHFDAHQREAELARHILEHQIRLDLLQESGVGYAVMPATQFSGDMVLAARAPDGTLYAVLADATGHGLAAAVSVLPVAQEFYRLVEQATPLIGIVDSINLMLANALPLGRFVAAVFVRVDEPAHRGEIWVGGMPSALLLDEAGEPVRSFPSRHMPLGVTHDRQEVGAVETFTWETACQLVVISDGVIEATDREGKLFGSERLRACMASSVGTSPIERLQADLRAYLDGVPAHDDMSVLAIDCPA